MLKVSHHIRSLFTFSLIAMTACSTSTVGSDAIATKVVVRHYTVNYYESSESVHAEADFTVESDGTHINLDGNPARIQFSKQEMRATKYTFGGRYYDADSHEPQLFSQSTIVEKVFAYTNADGVVATTPVTLKKLEITQMPNSINPRQAFVVNYRFPEPEAEEDVTLYMTQNYVSETDKGVTLTASAKALRSGTIVMQPADLAQLNVNRPVNVHVSAQSFKSFKDHGSQLPLRVRSSYITKTRSLSF